MHLLGILYELFEYHKYMIYPAIDEPAHLILIWISKTSDPRNNKRDVDTAGWLSQCHCLTVLLGRPSYKTIYNSETITLAALADQIESVTVSILYWVL